MAENSAKKFLILFVLGSVLTGLFVFLGTPVLRVMRSAFSSLKYWISGLIGFLLLISFGTQMLMISFLVFSLWVTVGVYQELEERGKANIGSAALAISLGSLVLIGGPWLVASWSGIDLVGLLSSSITEIAKQLAGGKSLEQVGFKPEAILVRIPSTIVLIQMTGLAFALMLSRQAGLVLGVRFNRVASEMKLLEFKAPDWMIWLTIFAFLGSFISFPESTLAIVSSNILVIMLGVYFFQGLAVMEVSFLVFRISRFLRLLIYFIVVGQLFFLLSAVGIVDYWVDFRQRLRKGKMLEKKQNGENI